MKLLMLVIATMALMSFTSWQTNLTAAKQEAQQKHKVILLNFSGSDWCGPCIRLHKEIFESPAFTQFADTSLVLVNADFPRQKKNQLSKEVQHENDLLADKYNPQGAFPFTVLLDADGKVLKTWDGLPKQKPEEFVNELDAVSYAHH
jgi:thioredoxin-related protein